MLEMARISAIVVATINLLGLVAVGCVPAKAEKLFCILCHSHTDSRCENPQIKGAEKMPAQVCTGNTSKCYVQFGTRNHEVDRGCYNADNMVVVVTCSRHMCNAVPAHSLPLISKRTEWFLHLKAMSNFMRINRTPLRCVSCASPDLPSTVSGREDYSHSNTSLSLDNVDLCYNMTQDRAKNMLITCAVNETCVTVRNGRHVSRGCSLSSPQDSLLIDCTGNMCNNHAETSLTSADSELLFKIIDNHVDCVRWDKCLCLCLLVVLSWF